jgi:hypothetical protein
VGGERGGFTRMTGKALPGPCGSPGDSRLRCHRRVWQTTAARPCPPRNRIHHASTKISDNRRTGDQALLNPPHGFHHARLGMHASGAAHPHVGRQDWRRDAVASHAPSTCRGRNGPREPARAGFWPPLCSSLGRLKTCGQADASWPPQQPLRFASA